MSSLSYNRIVQINVTQQYAPQPNKLQNTAAIVSGNSTTITPGTTAYIASPSSLSAYLTSAVSITGISWTSGVVTISFASAHGIEIGATTPLIVQNVLPSAYNGNYIATASTTTALTYSLASDPGAETALGTAIFGQQAWLIAADATWWAQNGQQQGYYVYESGQSTPATILTSVQTFLAANPKTIYNWGFLPGIDTDTTNAFAFFNLHNALTSLVKFYLPVTTTTYPNWSAATFKNVFAMIQSPIYGAATELDSIAYMAYITNITPSPTNKLPPSSYSYLYNVTAYPLTQALMTDFAAGHINYASTGAEGGISNVILINGDNLDGSPANVAYSIDWQQIQLDLDLSNAVINGSNSTINPLYYNQNGIDRLQAVAANTAARGIASGLALGQVLLVQLDPTVFAQNLSAGLYAGNYVINAVPFASYVAQNPSDYSQGLYQGFQASFVPQYGFQRIVFNLQATQFA